MGISSLAPRVCLDQDCSCTFRKTKNPKQSLFPHYRHLTSPAVRLHLVPPSSTTTRLLDNQLGVEMSRFARMTFVSDLQGLFLWRRASASILTALGHIVPRQHVLVGTDNLQMRSWALPGISKPRVCCVLHHLHHPRIRKRQLRRC